MNFRLFANRRPAWIAILILCQMGRVVCAAEPAEISNPSNANDGILIDRVWSGHPVSFALLTERGHQFIAYYDAERKITVTGRKLGETHWTRVQPEGVWVPDRNRFSNVTRWDSHNYLTLALDRNGCLHLSGNMHADGQGNWQTRPISDWKFHWETLGINRDMASRDVPPPSELRLYEVRGEGSSKAIPGSKVLEHVKTQYLAAFEVQDARMTAGVSGNPELELPAIQCWDRIVTLFPPEELSGIVRFFSAFPKAQAWREMIQQLDQSDHNS